MQYDVIFCNAWVYDGTGNPPYKGDVGVLDGKIAAIGCLKGQDAKRTVDVGYMALTPGFIDIHNHEDMAVLAYPGLDSHTMQGVTTSLGGNCGLSMAPVSDRTLDLQKKYVAPFLPKTEKSAKIDWKWRSVGDYLNRMEEVKPAHNIGCMIGQGTLRIAVKGFDPSAATPDEMKEMKRILRESLEDGAFGLSSGLIYAPGSFTTDEELTELAEVLQDYGALYATHMRSEGINLLESVDSTIALARKLGIRAEISHHKVSGRYNWGKLHRSLALIEQVRQEGVDITCDVYPYTAGSSTMTALLPPSALEGGVDETIKRLQDKEARAQIIKGLKDRSGWENLLADAGFDKVMICSCPSKVEAQGKTLRALVDQYYDKNHDLESFLDFLLEVKCNATMAIFLMDEDEMAFALTHHLSSVVSDAWAMCPEIPELPHPRSYGTFPRFIRKYALDSGRLTLEEAIRKITSLPASRMGLRDRGVIALGMAADIVVFDPKTIADTATYPKPHSYPTGIDYVMVNGQFVAEHGKQTGVRAGTVLRRK